MSPFEDVSARLTARVASLPLGAQVALFASGAEALTPRYLDWVQGTAGSVPNQVDLLQRAIDLGRQSAVRESSAAAGELLPQIEAATPGDPTDVEWFTAAQDCWICADTALRSSLGEFEAENSVWYLLEPVFQSTSERLFGFTDVGTELENELEGQALDDPALRRAVAALDAAVDLLDGGPVDAPLLARLSAVLTAISP